MLFPSPSGEQSPCVWNGHAFLVNGREEPVLAYDPASSGWTDELTNLHLDLAGDTHYMDVASRNHAIGSLRRSLTTPNPVIMDIGCSSGALLRALRQELPTATLLGADYISGPLRGLAAAMPGVPFLQFNLVTCPLFSNSLDAVVLLNVLEHIEDDVTAIQQTFRITKPGGMVVIEVPAGPGLFDVYDKQLMHFRRYRLESLCQKLEQAGFLIEERSHLGAFLYPFFAFVKKRNQRYLNSPAEIQKEIVAKSIKQAHDSPLMNTVMRMEAALGSFLLLPFGIRCVVTCRKPARGASSV